MAVLFISFQTRKPSQKCITCFLRRNLCSSKSPVLRISGDLRHEIFWRRILLPEENFTRVHLILIFWFCFLAKIITVKEILGKSTWKTWWHWTGDTKVEPMRWKIDPPGPKYIDSTLAAHWQHIDSTLTYPSNCLSSELICSHLSLLVLRLVFWKCAIGENKNGDLSWNQPPLLI